MKLTKFPSPPKNLPEIKPVKKPAWHRYLAAKESVSLER